MSVSTITDPFGPTCGSLSLVALFEDAFGAFAFASGAGALVCSTAAG